jgi:hypothetical protein
MAWRSPTVRAEDSSVVILGDNTDSPISIGIPPATLPGIIKAATKPLEDLTDQQRRNLELLCVQLEVSAGALRGFLLAIGEANIPIERQPAKLAEIATRHKDLLARLEATSSTDPEVQRLKTEARTALDAGDFTRTEELLNRAKARDLLVIEQMRATMEWMQAALDARRLSAAEAAAANGALMMTQIRYPEAARYYAEAVGLTPGTYPDPLSDLLTGWAAAAWRAGDYPTAVGRDLLDGRDRAPPRSRRPGVAVARGERRPAPRWTGEPGARWAREALSGGRAGLRAGEESLERRRPP